MSTAVAVRNEKGFKTPQEIQADANLIQQVMKAVMRDKVHFGTVPGCGDKPTLLKPGAEKILATFRIAVDPEIEDLSAVDIVKYRIKARGMHTLPDGTVIEVGKGVGVCSSNEEKYKWRKAVNDSEFSETPEDRRRKKWKKYNGKPYQELQVRTAPEDLENTILKMAKKRALVDLCLTATAASDCFNQDIEDLPAEYVDDAEQAQPADVEMPRKKSAEPQPAAEQPKADQAPPSQQETRPVPSGFRIMASKYDGLCRGCKKEIRIGDQIAYSATKGTFHPDCVEQ